jgi:SAM-dependent methyltransferase
VAPSPTSDLYDAIAPIYDEWQSWRRQMPFALVAAEKLRSFLDREAAAAERAGRDRPALLDVGCGTGTLLVDVRRARPAWRLAGVDASPGMLAVARAKRPEADDVTWTRAHLGAPLPFARELDVCTSFYDTLNHVPDLAGLAGTFAAAAAILRPGGLLVFDVTSRRGFEQWWQGVATFQGAGWQMELDADFDPTTEIATGYVTFKRDRVTRLFQIHERYFGREEIVAALAAAGFSVEHEEPWDPFPVGGLGKTWWAARLANDTIKP